MPARDAIADDLLTRFAARGETAALEALVAHLRDDALRVARARLGPSDAEDAVQAAFLAVLDRAAVAWRPGSDARAWIMTLVVNACRMRRRSAEARARHERHAADGASGATAADPARDAREELAAAMARIDEPYRSAVERRYLSGLDYPALAREMGVPVKTARSRVARGIAELRRRLRDRAGAALVLVALRDLEDGSPAGASASAGVLACGSSAALVAVLALALLSRAAVTMTAPAGAPPSLGGRVEDLLDRPIAVEFHHDHLPEAIAALRAAEPALRAVRWAYPRDFDGSVVAPGDDDRGWSRCFPWEGVTGVDRPALPLRAALDEIASGLGLRWRAVGDVIGFWRPLTDHERQAFEALPEERFLPGGGDDGGDDLNGIGMRAASDLEALARLGADTGHPLRAQWVRSKDAGRSGNGRAPLSALLGDAPPEEAIDAPAVFDGEDEAALCWRLGLASDPRDRAAIESALARHGDPVAIMLANAGEARGDAARAHALRLLAPCQDPRVLPALRRIVLAFTDDWWSSTRPELEEPLGAVAGFARLAAALDAETQPRFAGWLAAALLATRDPRAPARVAAIVALGDARAGECAAALAGARDPRAEADVLRLLREGDEQIRLEVVTGCARTRSRTVLAALTAAAGDDPEPRVRSRAIRSISELRALDDDVVDDALRAALRDPHALPRGEAAILLDDSGWPAPRFSDDLRRLALDDVHPYVRASALWLMCASGETTRGAASQAVFLAALRDDDARARIRAALALWPSDPGRLAALVAATRDPVAAVEAQARLRLREWIAKTGSGDAVIAAAARGDDAADIAAMQDPGVLPGACVPPWTVVDDATALVEPVSAY